MRASPRPLLLGVQEGCPRLRTLANMRGLAPSLISYPSFKLQRPFRGPTLGGARNRSIKRKRGRLELKIRSSNEVVTCSTNGGF